MNTTNPLETIAFPSFGIERKLGWRQFVVNHGRVESLLGLYHKISGKRKSPQENKHRRILRKIHANTGFCFERREGLFRRQVIDFGYLGFDDELSNVYAQSKEEAHCMALLGGDVSALVNRRLRGVNNLDRSRVAAVANLYAHGFSRAEISGSREEIAQSLRVYEALEMLHDPYQKSPFV